MADIHSINDIEAWFVTALFAFPMIGGGILYWAPFNNPHKSDKIIGMSLMTGYPLLYFFITYLLFKCYKMSVGWYPILGFLITGIILGPSMYGITFFNPTKDSQGNDVPPTKASQTYGGLLFGASVVFFVAFIVWCWNKSKSNQPITDYQTLSS